MENRIRTDARLDAALSFIENGAVAADVGTDHGYIPIYLVQNGISPFAYASDVNAQPLAKAKANAEKYGVSDRISFHLCDGLGFIGKGEMNGEHPVDTVVVCGMGGELIAKIIDASAYVKRTGVRLVLQPMTRADKLRTYLAANGFAVLGEKLCTAAGKIYTVICAEYDGVERVITDAEAILGRSASDGDRRLAKEYLAAALKKQRTKIDGMNNSSRGAADEKKLYRELKRTFRKGKREGTMCDDGK